MTHFTDEKIKNFLNERKILREQFAFPPKLKRLKTNLIAEFNMDGDSGNEFVLIIRKSSNNDMNFSISLLLIDKNNDGYFLSRYSGNWHTHNNKIENDKIKGCHIHIRTERYCRIFGEKKADGYAIPTKKYLDWEGALICMLHDYNIITSNSLHQYQITVDSAGGIVLK